MIVGKARSSHYQYKKVDKYLHCGWFILEKIDHCQIMFTRDDMGTRDFALLAIGNAHTLVHLDLLSDGIEMEL